MTRIDGANGINNNIKVKQSAAAEIKNAAVNSTFGDGFASRGTSEFVSVDSRFKALAAKFDFDIPKYPKGGFAQFAPADKDFEAMRHLDAALDKSDADFCEV
ncbi:MAG: hypothetical protein NC191_06675 [Muribaculaceae bacterium]|nr:hypothetical protein [Muribaculaceae bacterium]